MRPEAPAWAKESMHVRLASPSVTLDDLSDEWAFGGATGNGVRVAVIDSGIDAGHPGLQGAVDANGGASFSVDDDGRVESVEGPHRDAFGHGTACAGIVHELAPDAKITSVKVLGDGLSGKAPAFLAGLRWAIDQGFDVINLSLGSSRRDTALAFHDLCDRAYFRGCVVVTAANNLLAPSYPSLFSSVISVASNFATDPRRFHYNPDPPTEFLARGIDVPVLWKDHETTVVTGNSYAAPHIVGLAALVRSKHRDLRPFQVKTVLWARAANVVESSQIEIAGRLTQMTQQSAARRTLQLRAR